MKSLWSGHIRFSLVTIPVRIYGALEYGNDLKFRQLHRTDNSPIGYQKKCKSCDEIVSSKDIVKGYEYEPDQYVVIEPEDLEKMELKSTKIIEIEAFINESEIHPSLFEKPYYLGPDGDVAMTAYALLAETLSASNKMAIGRVVMREKEKIVLIDHYKKGLILYELRSPEELRNVEDIPDLEKAKVDKAQLDLAANLVTSMTKSFSDVSFKDEFKDAVMKMIQAKIDGKEVVTIGEEEEKPFVDIMDALKASIEQAKQGPAAS